MSARTKKAAARALLAARDLAGIATWARDTRGALRALFSLTYEDDALLRWRAIEAAGPAAAAIAEHGLGPIRRFLRGLFWLMNDESGGLGWRAPEVIGETLRAVPGLVEEYARLLPGFLVEEPFQRGTHLALARLAPLAPAIVLDAAPRLRESLADPDPAIRAHATAALAAIDRLPNGELLAVLIADDAAFTSYDFDSGQLRETTVGAATRALRTPRG